MMMLSGAYMDKTDTVQTCVVCDAGPVIHLDELDALHLLNDFDPVMLPPCVVNEITQYRPNIFKRHDVRFSIVAPPRRRNPDILTLCNALTLHSGEIEALALLDAFPHALFLTDDSAARLVAQRLGYAVHGTIGVLIRAIRRQLMTPVAVIVILDSIPHKSSLHIKASLLEEIVLRLHTEFHL